MLKRAAATIGLVLASNVHAQVIDQAQTSTLGFKEELDGGDIVYQTFVPGLNTVIGAGFFLSAGGAAPPANLFIQLLDSPGGSVLAGGSVAVTNSTAGWVDVFWSAVSVTPGKTYALSVSDDDPATLPPGYFVATAGNASDGPYSGGELLISDVVAGLVAFPHYDAAFREFAANTTSTPEPSTFVLIASGLAAFAIFAVTRRLRPTSVSSPPTRTRSAATLP